METSIAEPQIDSKLATAIGTILLEARNASGGTGRVSIAMDERAPMQMRAIVLRWEVSVGERRWMGEWHWSEVELIDYQGTIADHVRRIMDGWKRDIRTPEPEPLAPAKP